MKLTISLSTAAALTFASFASIANAQEQILTLVSADGEQTSFSLRDLQDMGETTFVTSTIWTEGAIKFGGVSLKDLLSDRVTTGGSLLASAINDYTVEIPVSDAIEGGPIVAYHMNGEPMSIRDKGPLWIVYPYDSNSEYQTEVTYSRSIWQLDRIEVVE